MYHFFYLETRPLDRVLFKASSFPTCFREKKDKAVVRQFKILIFKQIRTPYSSCIWAIQSNNNRSCNQLQIFLTNDFILHPQPSNSNEESVFFLYSASYTYRSLLEIDELPDIAKPIRYLCVCSKRKNQWLKFIHQYNWEERGTGAVCYIWNNLSYNIRNTLSKLWI